jgi:hypothetical protein
MKPRLHKNRALSTVLTTVIILVASVVLGSGVVLYGASLFQGGTQQESIAVSGVNIWVLSIDPTDVGIAWGAAGIRNTGDKVLAIDKIQIRGEDVPFTQWYADTSVTATLFQQAFNHTGWQTSGQPRIRDNCASADTYVAIDLDSGGSITECISADAGTGPVSLSPGESAIIYFKLNNGTLSSLDSGASTSVNIFAGKTGAPQSVTIQGVSNTG